VFKKRKLSLPCIWMCALVFIFFFFFNLEKDLILKFCVFSFIQEIKKGGFLKN